MATIFKTGIVTGKESYAAGAEAAHIAATKLGKHKPDIAVIFASSDYNQSELMNGIRSVIPNVPVIGCSAAGTFTEDEVSTNGVACALIASDNCKFFSGISKNVSYDVIEAVKKASENFPLASGDYTFRSAIVLVDGLIGKGEEIVLAAHAVLGTDVKFSGGAAADNYEMKKTLVFSNGQALEDAVSICMIHSKSPVIISIKHGHKPLSPSLTVTKSKDNIVYEIDNQPAFDVWKKHLEKEMERLGIDIKNLSNERISEIFQNYEAGLQTGTDYKVRFPTSLNPNGAMKFGCSMMEGSVIKIMCSSQEDQIVSAKIAAKNAIEQAKGRKIAGALIFDCSCRRMILKDKFSAAVNEIKQVLNVPIIGFETYGEIAMEMGELSGFHNATTVIMLLPE